MKVKVEGSSKNKFRKKISYFYLIIVLIGSFLLFSPLTSKNGEIISFIDAFFISASAFSDTGLSPIITVDTINNFGQLIILILVQVGGMGVMTFKIILLLIVGKKINTTDRMLIFTEQNLTNHTGLVRLIKEVFIIIFACELLFSLIIGLHMMFFYHYDCLKALWFGFFHAISAINNAGFDLTGNSFINFSNDYLFQGYIMILIIIGGLGFPILLDIKKFIIAKINKDHFKFSLFSRISIYTYFVITIIAFILICLVDYQNLFINNNYLKGIFYSLFHVISARNAGFVTTDLSQFSQASQLIIAILMFIGAAPASTGGGIRTTTFALIFLFLKTNLFNKNDIEAYNRRIPKQTVYAAFITFSYAIFLVTLATFVVVVFDPQSRLIEAFFEVCSAFGTTGLTLDFTQDLNTVSKLVIALVMVIGQIGIANSLLLFTKDRDYTNNIRLPEENITIG
ncbi:MAG: TrkH family potassium uptake protein [Bacilli bacterium]|jgi:Trk-type K+ transport system membrane component|nr:TrkH family potassium uptake protein [Bacilli bacterium]